MKKKEIWQLGMRNVFAAPVRTGLTVLGMAIGIASILAVLTLGNAGQEQVRSEMNRLGIDKVWITADAFQMLEYGDGIRAAETLSLKATEQIYLTEKIETGKRMSDSVVIGCTNEYAKQIGLQLSEGQMLTAYEWGNTENAVLLGKKIAEELEVQPGDRVCVRQNIYTIRGIVGSAEGVTQYEPEQALFVPIHLLLDSTQGKVHEMLVEVPKGDEPERISRRVQHMLYLQQRVEAKGSTMQLQIEAANSVIDTFISVLGWVAVICMLVGGIGVMNILLVGVRERKREIGIMQSLGTERIEITLLFLWEALVYALIGGFLGIIIGIALIEAAGKSIELDASVKIWECIAVLLAAVCTGLFFGAAPAVKASGLKPVDALRAE